MVDERRLAAEARRIYLRYAVELVEELGLCPWAAEARRAGRVAIQVVPSDAPAMGELLDLLSTVERDAHIDIGLLVFPRLALPRAEFRRLTARLREADAQRKGRGNEVLALADFHPDAEADLRSPERLISFVRRSPDPTIQLVRRSALAQVRLAEDTGTRFVDASTLPMVDVADLEKAPEPLSRRIARNNLRTVEALGVDQVRRRMDDIFRDRQRSYARLGLSAPPWSSEGAKDPAP